MREMKDSEIKLFGKKIALPENDCVVVVDGGDSPAAESGDSGENGCGSERDRSSGEKKLRGSYGKGGENDTEKQEDEKDHLSEELSETKSEDKDQDHDMDGSDSTKTQSESDSNTKTPSTDENSSPAKSSKTENDQSETTNNSQQKTLKKPDKILPCPRCNSMDTKFCYYNNYNVNQPRHFCKSCQRYWTAGGTMRNVPVGAGRRKNKNSAPHCRHITITEALQEARIDVPNGFHHPAYKPNNGTVLSFGPEPPLCESMASLLNLAEKKGQNGNSSNKVGENGDDCSSVSSVTTTSSNKNSHREAVMPNINGFPSPVQCLPGVPWPYPWNAAVPLPAICPPGFPMPFCPAPYWNCAVPGPWNLPWLAPPSPTVNQKALGSAPTSPLGKHSREGELLSPNNPESSEQKNSGSSVLVPKTLRIDDPDEAAKSSIWSTLGIKYDSISRGGLFKALQPKCDEKSHRASPPPSLQANPAALSRSFNLQEST